MILLIHPPVAKPCEPPAGIARLSGMLEKHGIGHRLWDANLEGLLHLLRLPKPPDKTDNWTRRAFRNRQRNISSLRGPMLCRNLDRYSRAVRDLGRALEGVSPAGSIVGLANYEHETLSPLRSGDLIAAAEQPELSPFYPHFRERLEGLFLEREPMFIGISLNYLSQALCAFSMIGHIRRELPGMKIVLGGGLVTSWLRNPGWKDPFSGLVDHMVAGPGESQLLSILGISPSDGGLLGPSYRRLPFGDYLSPGFILPYAASSGCYWARCDFCPEKAEGSSFEAVPPETAIADLEALAGETDPLLIHMLDNAVSPAVLDAIVRSWRGASWYGFARVSERLADPDYCVALRKVGCVMLKLGIESGDQAVLDSLRKGTDIQTASAVLRNLRKAGIGTYVYLLFGTPPEDETAARRTLDFTAAHSDCIDFLNLAIFNMPVCGAGRTGVELKDFSDGDLSLYTDFRHPAGWGRKAVRRFIEREFRRHPAITKIIRREPPVFSSNHAAFFLRRG